MIRNYFLVAFRNLKRHQGYSIINIVGLAVGLACALIIGLYVRHELSYDKHHVDHDRIFRVVTGSESGAFEEIAKVAGPWGPAIARSIPGVEEFTRLRFANTTLITGNGKKFYENGGFYADSSFFDVFSSNILEGSSSGLVEPDAIVITSSFASKYFGESSAIGQTLTLSDRDFNVSAVIDDVPDNSHFHFDYLLPLRAEPDSLRFDLARTQYYTYLYLGENIAAENVQTALRSAIASIAGDEAAANYAPRLQAIASIHLKSNLFREMEPNGNLLYVYIFSIVAGLVLLLACINFVNLATARSIRRAREVGVRKASGARRHMLISRFLSEAFILSVFSVLVGILFVSALLPSFNRISGKSLEMTVFLEPEMIVGLLLLTVVTSLLAGLYPAFVLSAFKPAAVLKGETRVVRGSLLRKGLVVFQFAVSVFLIGSVGIINNQLDFIQDSDLGFEREQLLIIPIRDDAVRLNSETVKREIKQLPGVVSASVSGNLPGGGDYGFPLFPESISDEDRPRPRILVTDHDFIDTFRMSIAEGRDFSQSDATAGGAFLVNETLAQQLRQAGWENVVGKTIGLPPSISENVLSVVGVVEDFHFRSLHEEIGPLAFFMPPPEWYSVFSVRVSSTSANQTVEAINNVWSKFDAENPMTSYFLDESFEALYQSESTVRQLLSYATILAIFVACMGLFGLAAFTAEQRTKEIGIRKVLGASIGSVVLLLTRSYTILVGIALLIALPVAYIFGDKWLDNFAYRASLDVTSIFIAGLAALAIAVATVSYQSLKAAMADPVNSLRYE